MKTLADMTPDEREACVGMWCKMGEDWLIIMWVDGDEVVLTSPAWTVVPIFEEATRITPRFDLPRAWMPDGKPVAGEWETAKAKIIPNENARYDDERGIITGDGIADINHEPRSSHDIRRFVTEWEEIK